MPVNIQYSPSQITDLNKTRFADYLKHLSSDYAYNLYLDHLSGSIVLDIKTQPKTVTNTEKIFFGLFTKTSTEIHQFTLAHVEFFRYDSGEGYVNGTREQNKELINFINMLSKIWIDIKGKVKEIDVNITATPPADLFPN